MRAQTKMRSVWLPRYSVGESRGEGSTRLNFDNSNFNNLRRRSLTVRSALLSSPSCAFIFLQNNNRPRRPGVPSVASMTTVVMDIQDVGQQVLGFAGGKQFMYLAPVSTGLRALVGKGTETEDSEVVLSVSRTLAAFLAGWSTSERALKEAAAAGSLGVLKLFRFLGVPWCDGMFAAAVEHE